jgi:hypothetical protein
MSEATEAKVGEAAKSTGPSKKELLSNTTNHFGLALGFLLRFVRACFGILTVKNGSAFVQGVKSGYKGEQSSNS